MLTKIPIDINIQNKEKLEGWVRLGETLNSLHFKGFWMAGPGQAPLSGGQIEKLRLYIGVKDSPRNLQPKEEEMNFVY